MADDVKQVFTLDASQAINALKQLDVSYAALQDRMQQSVASFTFFNQGAGRTVAALIQIEQRATAAANALSRLNNIKPPPSVAGGGLPGVGGSNLLQGQATAQALNQLLGQTTAQANQVAVAINNVGQSAGGSSSRANGFALSLETVSRILATQVIVRSLGAITRAIQESFSNFVEFSTSVAQIQTILSQPVEVIAASVRKLSDSFNVPLLDVARAKYQALSNGFVTDAESANVLTAAIKLSKVGISTVTQSVDLLSTALNSYALSSDAAETVAAKFFKVIDLGRVTAADLSGALGRVAPVASQIGVSLDEVGAAFSSITVGGVKASEAATQIRASLVALLKPSDDMKKAFRELGVETGEQLVAAKGFQGAFQAVIATTDGTQSSIAKLFPNVRALSGVLRETSTGADIFTQHLTEIQNAARDLLNTKFEVFIKSNAEPVARDLNKIKNFFTAEIGKELVKAFQDFFRLTGGVQTTIDAIKNFAPAAATLVGSLLTFTLISTAARIRQSLFAASTTQATAALAAQQAQATATGVAVQQASTQIGALGSALQGISIGVVLGTLAQGLGRFIGDSITRLVEAPRLKEQEEANKRLEFQRSQAEARANLDKIEADKRVQVVQDMINRIRAVLFTQTDAAKAENKRLIAEDGETLNRIIAARERFATDLKRAVQQAENDEVSSKKRTNDLLAELDDARFNFQNRRFGQLSQLNRDRNRAEQLASDAARKLSVAKTPDEKEAADNEFRRATAFAQQAASVAQTTGSLAAQRQAELTIESVIQKRIAAEKQFQSARDADAARLRAASADEEARVDRIKTNTKLFLDALHLFDDQGNRRSDKDIAANQAKAKALLPALLKDALESNKVNVQDIFNFDKLRDRLDSALTGARIDQLKTTPEAIQRLVTQIQGVFNENELIVQLGFTRKDVGDVSGTALLDTLQKAVTERQADRDKTAAQATIERTQATEALGTALKNINTDLGAAGAFETAFNSLSKSFANSRELESGNRALAGFQNQIRFLAENISNITPGNVKNLKDLFDEFVTAAPRGFAGFQVGRIRDAITELDKAQKAQDKLRQTKGAPDQLQALQAAEQAAGRFAETVVSAFSAQEAANKALTEATAAAQTAATSGATIAATAATSAQTAAEAAQKAAEAAAQARQSAIQGSGENQAFGGAVGLAFGGMPDYLAGGGFQPRGVDNIPAMLARGESVINSDSTRRFFSQIMAINAGIPPVFRSQGGDVTNVGDISINVNGSGSPQKTGDEVVRQIRRVFRKGTSRKF